MKRLDLDDLSPKLAQLLTSLEEGEELLRPSPNHVHVHQHDGLLLGPRAHGVAGVGGEQLGDDVATGRAGAADDEVVFHLLDPLLPTLGFGMSTRRTGWG